MPYQYTMEDDMESYYYVVLYCGNLWIRQSKAVRRRSKITQFFGEKRSDEFGYEGGNAKMANIFYKNSIRKFFCLKAPRSAIGLATSATFKWIR